MSIAKIAKVIELMKDKLGEKIMAEFVARKPKTYAYLMGDGINGKKAKQTKKCKKNNDRYLSLIVIKVAY